MGSLFKSLRYKVLVNVREVEEATRTATSVQGLRPSWSHCAGCSGCRRRVRLGQLRVHTPTTERLRPPRRFCQVRSVDAGAGGSEGVEWDQVASGFGSDSTIRTVSTLTCTTRRMAVIRSRGSANQSFGSLTIPLLLCWVIR